MKNLFYIFLGALSISAASADELSVKITELRSTGGYLLVGVFDSHAALESSKYRDGNKYAVAFKVLEVTSRAPSATLVFSDLPAGVYAVGVICDLNSNGQLDTKGPFRKPTEPFGMSRNPRVSIKFPKWEDVAFRVSGRTAIQIELKHL